MTSLPVISIFLKQYFTDSQNELKFVQLHLPRCLLDSGTDNSLISTKQLEKSKITQTKLPQSLHIRNVLNQVS